MERYFKIYLFVLPFGKFGFNDTSVWIAEEEYTPKAFYNTLHLKHKLWRNIVRDMCLLSFAN